MARENVIMQKLILVLLAAQLFAQPFAFGQVKENGINEAEARRILSFLAADSLKGRGNGSKELLKAGMFVGEEFRKAGLQVMDDHAGYFHAFRPFGGSKVIVTDELIWNGRKLLPEQFMYLHPQPGNYAPRGLEDFTVIKLDSFFTTEVLHHYLEKGTDDLLLWSDKPQPDKENYFPPAITLPPGGLRSNVLMVCTTHPPDSIRLSGLNSYYSNVAYNVVGMLKGRSRANEIIMFSAHYDHEGVYLRGKRKDSILNGANDNASGVAALVMLANYFAGQNNNERTLLFCAFSGEEIGLTGSKDLAARLKVDDIKAGINLEMLGVQGYGRKGVFITGPDASELPGLLRKHLVTAGLKVKAGPSEEEKELFKRSDNYPFVLKGVPYHTIMSSDDDDACYHQPCDEIKRVNMPHLVAVVKAVAAAAAGLISGEETPARMRVVNIEQ